MDVVYLLKTDDLNEELRYSLRSLKNLPHNRVFFVGHQPYWTKNIADTIEMNQIGKPKHLNTYENLLAACRHEDISDDFILMNDDIFIMKPLKELKTYHRGLLKDVIAAGYKNGVTSSLSRMERTLEYLAQQGISDALCYELHIPIVINKAKYLKIHDSSMKELSAYNKRTLYGNIYKIGGQQMNDVKISKHTFDLPDTDFLSTNDKSFRGAWVGEKIRETFREYSDYERHD